MPTRHLSASPMDRLRTIVFTSFVASIGIAQPAQAGQASNQVTAHHAQSMSSEAESLAVAKERGPLQRAEAAYRARRYPQALEAFGLLAAADNHPFAWLRIGNIWHRRGEVAMAMDAYSHARDAAASLGQQRGLRERAIVNIALLSLDQAQLALDAMSPSDSSTTTRRWRAEVRLRLRELQAALDASGDKQEVLVSSARARAGARPGENESARLAAKRER